MVTGEKYTTSQAKQKLSGNKCLKYSSQKTFFVSARRTKIYALIVQTQHAKKREFKKFIWGAERPKLGLFLHNGRNFGKEGG